MKQLLGFMVLTGPLFLIVLWVPVCIALAVLVAKKLIKKSLPLKITGGLAVFLIILLLPVSDEIAGRIYFHHLCETEAGVKVYQQIELPAEYWDENGKPKFFNKQGYLKHEFWVNFIDEDSHVIHYSQILGIDKDFTIVKRKNSKRKLADIITFRFWGGWLRRNFSPHNTANSCQFLHSSDFGRNFYGKLFIQAMSSK